MKHRNSLSPDPHNSFARLRPVIAGVCVAATLFVSVSTQAQIQPPRGKAGFPGNRPPTPFDVAFERAWTTPAFADPVRLIEIGPVTDDKKNNLLLLVSGKDANDYKRKLLVTHWDGHAFVNDTSTDFLGTALDALLVGKFRSAARPTILTTTQPVKGKKPKTLPTSQIVTTEGVYAWTGSAFNRLFASPPNLRLALMLDGTPDQMVIGSGDRAASYEAGETECSPSGYFLNTSDAGYVRMGVGTQAYDGAKDFAPGVRYLQSYWNGRSRWVIGLQRGTPAATPEDPNATTGDRLIVYTPKLQNREKTFWKLTRSDDFDETWKSDPFPGRVLDVRVGDPKNENKDGLLVLTAENKDKERHLYFYAPKSPTAPR